MLVVCNVLAVFLVPVRASLRASTYTRRGGICGVVYGYMTHLPSGMGVSVMGRLMCCAVFRRDVYENDVFFGVRLAMGDFFLTA